MCENCQMKDKLDRLESRLQAIENHNLFASAVSERCVCGVTGWDNK